MEEVHWTDTFNKIYFRSLAGMVVGSNLLFSIWTTDLMSKGIEPYEIEAYVFHEGKVGSVLTLPGRYFAYGMHYVDQTIKKINAGKNYPEMSPEPSFSY